MKASEAKRISDYKNDKIVSKNNLEMNKILFLIYHYSSKGEYTITYKCYNHHVNSVIEKLRNMEYDVSIIPGTLDTFSTIMISWHHVKP